MDNLALADLWDKIGDLCGRVGSYDHSVYQITGVNASRIGLFRTGYGRMLLSAIEDINGIYSEILDAVNQAIEILEKCEV